MQENMLECFGTFTKSGYINIPEKIKNKLKNIRDYKVKVIIELPKKDSSPLKKYSFGKVRDLLKNVKGDLSSEVINERTDRL